MEPQGGYIPAHRESNSCPGTVGARRLDEQKKQVCPVGMLCDIKTVIRSTTKQGKTIWLEQKPGGLSEKTKGKNCQGYAIIKRLRKCKKPGSETETKFHSLIIYSPHLRPVLAQVFRGYPGIRTDSPQLKIMAPLECFFHRWEQFKTAINAEGQDSVAVVHTGLLYHMMEEELRDLMARKRIRLDNWCVMFKELWTIFTPGCTVISKQCDMHMGAKFTKGRYEETPLGRVYVLECKNIEMNNTRGWNSFILKIHDFDKDRPIDSLSCFPIEYSQSRTNIEEELRKRGDRYNKLETYSYAQYNGVALYHKYPNSLKTTKIRIEGRIMIDWKTWGFHSPGNGPVLQSLTADDDDDDDDDDDKHSQQWRRWYKDNMSPEPLDTQEQEALTKDQLIYTSPAVYGYSFSNGIWMSFFVDTIAQVAWDTTAFDALNLAPGISEALISILRLLSCLRRSPEGIADYKDKGTAILISGGPGTGKTHTAKAIADRMFAPLYILHAADLTGELADVQLELQKHLDTVWNWRSYLLIDGIDVFLQKQTADAPEKQKIKSMLLQSLKHRHGTVVFFTSNTEEMDAEFESMIAVKIRCPPLDETKRVTVWNSVVGKAMPCFSKDVSDSDLACLGRRELNGKEIGKATELGKTLADANVQPLRLVHLESAVKILKDTQQDLSAGA